MLNIDRIRVFTGTAHPQLAKDICSHLGIPLGEAIVDEMIRASIPANEVSSRSIVGVAPAITTAVNLDSPVS